MKPPEFAYVRPGSVKEAVAALATNDDAKILAGGQSLVPLMNFRLAAPSVLVDINRIPELSFVESMGGHLRLGAMTRTRALELDPLVRQSVPILAAAARWIGHVQIRNRGTVGGSLAHADPAAELPAICVLLGAELAVLGPRGERLIGSADFFQGFLTTALADDELIMEVRMPIPITGLGWGFHEFAQRRGDFALAGAAVTLPAESDGEARIAVFGTADRALRVTDAEDLLRAGDRSSASLDAVARLAGATILAEDPRSDAAFRRRLIETTVRRALDDAVIRASGGHPAGTRVAA